MIFPLKVIGRNEEDFEGFVVSVVQAHAPLSARTVATRVSHGEQLDAIYQEFTDSGRVLTAL
jgi:putative lipoic acid-binding regulatory protein